MDHASFNRCVLLSPKPSVCSAKYCIYPSYSSEMNLVEAIKDVQKQTGSQYPSRSLVAQHMILMGTQDKVLTFKTVCKRAEKCGLVELGSSGPGSEWITLKDPQGGGSTPS